MAFGRLRLKGREATGGQTPVSDVLTTGYAVVLFASSKLDSNPETIAEEVAKHRALNCPDEEFARLMHRAVKAAAEDSSLT